MVTNIPIRNTDITTLLEKIKLAPLNDQINEIDNSIIAIETAILGKTLEMCDPIILHPELSELWNRVAVRMITAEVMSKIDPTKVLMAVDHLSIFINLFHKDKRKNCLTTESIFEAIFQDQPWIINALCDLGLDLNQSLPNKNTPLVFAIWKQDLSLVDQLLSLKADPNYTDSLGITPLATAIMFPNIKIVESLIKYGANIHNEFPVIRATPLQQSIQYSKLDVFKLLCNYGANPKAIDRYGYDTLTAARIVKSNLKIIRILKELGLSDIVSREKLMRVELAHIWGLNGVSDLIDEEGRCHRFNLEGLSFAYSKYLILKYLKLFFEKYSHDNLYKEYEREIYEAFQFSFVDNELAKCIVLKKIKDKKPCVLFSPTEGHMICLLFCNDIIVVCNRGEGKIFYALNCFDFPTKKITGEVILKLTKMHKDVSSFYTVLFSLTDEFQGGLPMSSQKVGNCCWANPKASLLALFIIYLGSTSGKKHYKLFTTFARQESYRSYFANSQYKDPIIREKIHAKMNKKHMYFNEPSQRTCAIM